MHILICTCKFKIGGILKPGEDKRVRAVKNTYDLWLLLRILLINRYVGNFFLLGCFSEKVLWFVPPENFFVQRASVERPFELFPWIKFPHRDFALKCLLYSHNFTGRTRTYNTHKHTHTQRELKTHKHVTHYLNYIHIHLILYIIFYSIPNFGEFE